MELSLWPSNENKSVVFFSPSPHYAYKYLWLFNILDYLNNVFYAENILIPTNNCEFVLLNDCDTFLHTVIGQNHKSHDVYTCNAILLIEVEK